MYLPCTCDVPPIHLACTCARAASGPPGVTRPGGRLACRRRPGTSGRWPAPPRRGISQVHPRYTPGTRHVV